eukprot:2352228-Rhodomonas_salina.1
MSSSPLSSYAYPPAPLTLSSYPYPLTLSFYPYPLTLSSCAVGPTQCPILNQCIVLRPCSYAYAPIPILLPLTSLRSVVPHVCSYVDAPTPMHCPNICSYARPTPHPVLTARSCYAAPGTDLAYADSRLRSIHSEPPGVNLSGGERQGMQAAIALRAVRY